MSWMRTSSDEGSVFADSAETGEFRRAGEKFGGEYRTLPFRPPDLGWFRARAVSPTAAGGAAARSKAERPAARW